MYPESSVVRRVLTQVGIFDEAGTIPQASEKERSMRKDLVAFIALGSSPHWPLIGVTEADLLAPAVVHSMRYLRGLHALQ